MTADAETFVDAGLDLFPGVPIHDLGDDVNGVVVGLAVHLHIAVDDLGTVPGASGIAMIFTSADGENCIIVVPGANGTLSAQAILAHEASIKAAGYVLAQLETPLDGVIAAANANNVLRTVALSCDGGAGATATSLTVTGGTNTLTAPSSTKFYRLAGPRATGITNITKSGSILVFTYKAN